jgi:hypothetical protein
MGAPFLQWTESERFYADSTAFRFITFLRSMIYAWLTGFYHQRKLSRRHHASRGNWLLSFKKAVDSWPQALFEPCLATLDFA